jgi:hypothetical protein
MSSVQALKANGSMVQRDEEADEDGTRGHCCPCCPELDVLTPLWRLFRALALDHLDVVLLWWAVVEFIQKATLAAYSPVPGRAQAPWWDVVKEANYTIGYLTLSTTQWHIPPRELLESESHLFVAPVLSYISLVIMLWWLIKVLLSPSNLCWTRCGKCQHDVEDVTFTYYIPPNNSMAYTLFLGFWDTWCNCCACSCTSSGRCTERRYIKYKRNTLGELYVRELYWSNLTKIYPFFKMEVTQMHFKIVIAVLICLGIWFGYNRANDVNKSKLLDEVKFPAALALFSLLRLLPPSGSYYMQLLLESEDPKHVYDNDIPVEVKDKKIAFSWSLWYASTQSVLQAKENECLRRMLQTKSQGSANCMVYSL